MTTRTNVQAAFAAHVTTLAASLDGLDYYRLLGVSRQATADDVKRAFHRAATIYHPDAHRDAAPEVQDCLKKIFKRINEAYRILSDFGKRKQYDALLDRGGQVRMVENERKKRGPTSPEAALKTSAGKKSFRQALLQIKRKDYRGAKLNLQLALFHEGENCEPIRQKLAEVDKLLGQK